MSDSWPPHGVYSPWDSPGWNTGVGCHSLLQGIFSIQRSNSGLPLFRRILYQLSHKGSPRLLERVAYPFSSGSSQPRNWTRVSCIAGGFFTNWAIRETLKEFEDFLNYQNITILHRIFNNCYNKIRKLSSGHRTGKGQFSFQSQRQVMPKNVQTTTQLNSSHTLVK